MQTHSKKKYSGIYAYIFLASLLLCFAGLNNKFPLLVTNSGVYINFGFLKSLTQQQSLYPLFVAHSSWAKSIWLVIFSQSLILSILLYYYFNKFIEDQVLRARFYLVYILLVTFTMSASITVSTIAPTIFLSIIPLSFGLLLFCRKLYKTDRLFISSILVIACLMAMPTFLYISILSILGLLLSAKMYCFRTKLFIIILINIIIINLLLLWIYNYLSPGKYFTLLDWEYYYKHFTEYLNFSINNYTKPKLDGSTSKAIQAWFSTDVREFYLSRQHFRSKKFTILEITELIVSLVSLLGCIFFLVKKRSELTYVILYFIAVILLNSLNNEEYHNYPDSIWTILWILPLPLFMSLSNIKIKMLSNEYENKQTSSTISK